jgi:tRNA(fMet)-specific endonuclease VapC
MYILDTDHLSLIQRNGQEGKRILARLSAVENSAVSVAVITYEEQVRGRLNLVSKAKTLDERIRAYAGLQQISTDYRFITIISLDRAAALEHERLRKAYPRLGNMDLKIAAIALTNNATLLTRNYSDFGQITELTTEDWSAM